MNVIKKKDKRMDDIYRNYLIRKATGKLTFGQTNIRVSGLQSSLRGKKIKDPETKLSKMWFQKYYHIIENPLRTHKKRLDLIMWLLGGTFIGFLFFYILPFLWLIYRG